MGGSFFSRHARFRDHGPGTNSQDLFRALAANDGFQVERFEIAEPSLDDIFVSVVQGDEEEADA